MTITHILDTSALLVHFFDEPGADTVQSLWASGSDKPGISAVTIPELKARLNEELTDAAAAQEAVDAYLEELTICLPVDRAVAELAWEVKESCPARLPLVDALIAGTARAFGAVLVHRDSHLARIPRDVVGQIVLPGGQRGK